MKFTAIENLSVSVRTTNQVHAAKPRARGSLVCVRVIAKYIVVRGG